jgi:hypothetical protein
MNKYNHDTREDWETGKGAEDKFNHLERWLVIAKAELENFLEKATKANIKLVVTVFNDGQIQLWCPRGQDMSAIEI